MSTNEQQLAWIARAAVILDSFFRLLGRELMPRSGSPSADAALLYEFPLAVLAHNTADLPLLDWVNCAAAAAFETTPERLLGRPSAATTPADATADRAQLFESIRQSGFTTGYSGTRIGLTGRRFVIEDTTLLSLQDPEGNPAGHAAIIGNIRPETTFCYKTSP